MSSIHASMLVASGTSGTTLTSAPSLIAYNCSLTLTIYNISIPLSVASGTNGTTRTSAPSLIAYNCSLTLSLSHSISL